MNSETLLYWFVRSFLKGLSLENESSRIRNFDLVFETMLMSYELLNIDWQDRNKVSQRTLIHPIIFFTLLSEYEGLPIPSEMLEKLVARLFFFYNFISKLESATIDKVCNTA